MFARRRVGLYAGLVAFWKLGDGFDSSGNGFELTSNGVTHAAGHLGNCAVFDGGSNFDCGSTPELADEMTIAGWFRITGAGDEMFLTGAGSSDDAWYVVKTFSDVKCSVSDSYTELSAGFTAADDGNWHFVAVARDATTKKLWVDTTTATASDTYGAISTPSPLKLGSNWDGSYLPLEGELDAWGLWNRKLSDAEVTELYNSGTGLELA